MIGWIPVSSRSLRSRSIEIEGEVCRGAAVMPFFSSEGEVPLVMVVRPDQSRLYFFNPAETAPRVPLWGVTRLQWPDFSYSDGDEIPDVSGLWHYDPDWLLRARRFREMAAVSVLKGTNCAGAFRQPVQNLYFQRDLSRIRWVMQRAEGGVQCRRFARKLLLELPPSDREPTSEPPSSWRLDPMWLR